MSAFRRTPRVPISRKRLQPAKYTITSACTDKCSINEARIGERFAQMVLGWFEDGLNDVKISDLAREAGCNVTYGSLGRHRANHLEKLGENRANEKLTELDDIEALDLILKRGQTQIDNWKLTPSEWFKALDMKYKLTQGSTMDAMFAAMA